MKTLNSILDNIFVITLTLLIGIPLGLRAQKDNEVILDKIIVRVDNYIILKSDLEGVYQNYITAGNTHSKKEKCKLLNNLIMNKLMVAKAEIDSIVVTDNEVDANVDRRIQMLLQNLGNSVEELERMFNNSMENIKFDIRNRIREQMLSNKMASKITSNVSVTPAEVKQFFKKIPKDSLPFYSSDVEIAQIVKIVEISHSQKKKTKNILRDLRKKILNGESFANLAKKYSEDPSVQHNGGDMGYTGRGAMVSAYEAMAFKLKKGEISIPFESIFGFHIMQLIDRRGNEYNSRHILISPSPSSSDIERTKKILDSVKTQIIGNQISFANAAKKISDDKITKGQGGFFSTPDKGIKISIKKIDPEIYFIIDTMNVGNISKPIIYRTHEGKTALRILYFKNKLSPHQANLKDDWHRIRTATIAEKKDKILNIWFDKAKQDIFIKIDPDYTFCNILK